jgi:hypothetical protein
LDDIQEEPAKRPDWTPGNPLFRLENAITSPHAAYYRSGVPSPPVQGAPYSGVYVGDARNLFTNC